MADETRNKLTTNEFIRLLAAAGSAAVGAAIGLNNLVEETGIDVRIRKFKELSALPPTPENISLWRSFLRLNGAEIYARTKGWRLTAECIERFLTGDGESWNITPDILKVLEQRLGRQNPDQLWAIFTRDVIQNAFTDPKNFISRPPRKKMLKKIANQQSFDLNFTAASNTKIAEDFWSSLNRFAIIGETTVSNPSLPNTGDTTLTLTNTNLSLTDTYDWPKILDAGISLSSYDVIMQGARYLGVNDPEHLVIDTFGQNPVTSFLDDQKLAQLNVEDGLILQESKYFKPYKIYTDVVTVKQPINVDVSFVFFNSI
jgi:hypothetical protein